MNIEEDIMKYKNLEIIKYLNKMHPVYDESLIINSRNEQKDLLKKLDNEIYKFFELKSDDLLELLITNEKCCTVLSDFKFNQKVHLKLAQPFENEHLKKAFMVFKDDMSVFITDRYVVKSGFTKDKKTYLLLTNDMLFIGKKDGNNYKYFDSVSIKSLKTELTESFYIKSDSFEIELEKSDFTEELHNSILDLNYEFTSLPEKETEKIAFIDFCIQTKRFDEILKFMKENPSKCKDVQKQVQIEVKTKEDLLNFIQIIDFDGGENSIKILIKYFALRFQKGLIKINKIQKLECFINDSFNYLNKFCDELINFCKNNNINTKCYVLAIEIFIKDLILFLRPRIESSGYFNNFNPVELLKNRFIICNLDYNYVLENVKFKSLENDFLENSKSLIRKYLKKYFES